ADLSVTAPDLALTAAAGPSTGVVNGVAAVSWTVTNLGSVRALAQWNDDVYISRSPTFDQSARYVQSFWTGWNADRPPLDPSGGAHDRYSTTQNVTLPGNLGTGQFYLFVVANGSQDQGESDGRPSGPGANNVSAALPITLSAPDLAVSDVSAAASASWNESF